MAENLGTRISRAADVVGGKRALAQKASIKESQVFRYISGANIPSAEVAVRIANAAGLDIRWLLTGEEPCGPEPSPSPCPYLSLDVSSLSPMDRGNALRYARELRNLLDKQESQAAEAKNLLRRITRLMADGGKKS